MCGCSSSACAHMGVAEACSCRPGSLPTSASKYNPVEPMSTFIDSAYPTKAAYDAAQQLTPALRAEDEAKVEAGFEKLTTLEKFKSIADRRSLGDGRSIPVVGLGLYYTPPGAATYDIVAEALKRGYRCATPHSLPCRARPTHPHSLQTPRYRRLLRKRSGRWPRCS